MRYRIVIALDAAEDTDHDFADPIEIHATEVHTRAGLPDASSVGPDNVETFAPVLSEIFRGLAPYIEQRLSGRIPSTLWSSPFAGWTDARMDDATMAADAAREEAERVASDRRAQDSQRLPGRPVD